MEFIDKYNEKLRILEEEKKLKEELVKYNDLIKKWENVGFLHNVPNDKKVYLVLNLEKAVNYLLAKSDFDKNHLDMVTFPILRYFLLNNENLDVIKLIDDIEKIIIENGLDNKEIQGDIFYQTFIETYKF